MKALVFAEYGSPDVLRVADVDEPHAGPGQVRIKVRAASVNPFDWKMRAGYLKEMVPLQLPAVTGVDAAGVVDQVGEGVDGVAVGDEVFGLGAATAAEVAVLDMLAAKPKVMPFEEAAALGLAVEAGARCLDILDLHEGSTVLLDGAAGGVGSAATQLAVARGLVVIGTASPEQHDYLRSLGALPTTYGPGLADRVEAIAPRVDGAIDLAGKGSVPQLVEIAGDPRRVVTLADFTAGPLGVHVADGSHPRASYALAEAARLYTEGRLSVRIQQVFPLDRGAEAHALSESGHVHGKLVLTVP